MNIESAFLSLVGRQELTRAKAGYLLFFFVHRISGCAVLNNSASFYQDQPRRADQLARIHERVTECMRIKEPFESS